MTEPNTAAQQEPAAPTPGSPEYEAKMAELGRQSRENTNSDIAAQLSGQPPADDGQRAPAAKERPADVPEKFWDAEKGEVRVDALLKSYTELESGKGKAAADPAKKDDQEPNATKETVEKAGLNWDDITTKVSTKGTLDDADFAALEKIGVPKDLAERVIANEVELAAHRASAQERATAEANAYVGGTGDPVKDKAATDDLLKWAGETLSKDQIEGYNALLAGPNWKAAVDTLKALRAKSNPGNGEPSLVNPTTPASGGTTVGYKTEDEMRADIAKPLYREMTPAGEQFRAQVQERTRLAAWRRNR